jgi:Holliday junction resolvase-like predicted endonuclease
MAQTNNFEKSTRHSLIIGNLGERLVCNWLSRKGFEVAVVDHTGIDIIARKKNSDEIMGITVKARARNSEKKEKSSIHLFNVKKKDLDKTKNACESFKCTPWIAVYIEAKNYADMYLTPFDNYWNNINKYCNKEAKGYYTWKLTKDWLPLYDADEKVHHLHLKFEEKRWF